MNKTFWAVLLKAAGPLAENRRLCRLRGDLTRNWDRLSLHFMRKGLEKSVRCYGTRVSNYRPYAYGMKKEGRCWGKEGCLAMARVLAGLQNGKLEAGFSGRLRP